MGNNKYDDPFLLILCKQYNTGTRFYHRSFRHFPLHTKVPLKVHCSLCLKVVQNLHPHQINLISCCQSPLDNLSLTLVCKFFLKSYWVRFLHPKIPLPPVFFFFVSIEIVCQRRFDNSGPTYKQKPKFRMQFLPAHSTS